MSNDTTSEDPVIDVTWSDSIKERLKKASKDSTANESKEWMLDRVAIVAYYLDVRHDCSTCQTLKKEIENLCEYYESHKNGPYEERRVFLARFSDILVHLNKAHKMVNRGQMLVVGAFIGMIVGIGISLLKGDSMIFCIITGIILGLFVGRINEIKAERDRRILI